MELRYGDRVLITNLGIEGQVIEVDTRTVVVRYEKADGELERREALGNVCGHGVP